MGKPQEYPGLRKYKATPTGCMKDEANHARQVTDTSSINIFLDDESFRKIVLGENYFRLTGLDSEYQAPYVCGQEVINFSHLIFALTKRIEFKAAGGLTTEAIIGIAVGVSVAVLIVLAVIIGVICYMKKGSGDGQ